MSIFYTTLTSIGLTTLLFTGCGSSSSNKDNNTTENNSAEGNTPPVAKAGKDITVQINKNITIKGTATDSDGNIVSVQWTEEKKTLSTDLSFTYQALSAGKHQLTLTVLDDDGASNSDSLNIVVKTIAPTELPSNVDEARQLILGKWASECHIPASDATEYGIPAIVVYSSITDDTITTYHTIYTDTDCSNVQKVDTNNTLITKYTIESQASQANTFKIEYRGGAKEGNTSSFINFKKTTSNTEIRLDSAIIEKYDRKGNDYYHYYHRVK